MHSGLKRGLAVFFLLLGALVLVDGHRCSYRRRRPNECPEWKEVTENVTESYYCSREEARQQGLSCDGNPLSGWRRKRAGWTFRFRLTVFGSRSRWRSRCICETTTEVTRYNCERKCCEGWKRDKTYRRRCSIQIEDPERLTTCDNGGTITTLNGKHFCTCPPGFTGEVCETATCRRPCLNGGRCDETLDSPTCVCQPGFIGECCEQPSCNCQNGGSCLVNHYVPVCMCKEGFSGDSCQYIARNGTCPTSPPEEQSCEQQCVSDGDCPAPQICCDNSPCGSYCSTPQELVCNYKGIEARIGETFKPSPCEDCTCANPDPRAPNGGALCAVMDCPRIVNCSRTVRDHGECCARCAEPLVLPTVDSTYKEPHFRNCPDKIVVLDLPAVGSVVKMPNRLMPVAVTHTGVELAVNLSQAQFKAGRGEQNFHSVIATSARDERGNFVRCKFFIRVRDTYRPVFTSCPADIEVQEGTKVEWDEPTATDNVGLIGDPKLVTRIPAGHIFDVGDHTVIYVIEDLEGNTATCDFIVAVYKSDLFGGDDDSSSSDSDDSNDAGDTAPVKKTSPHHPANFQAALIGACAAVLFLVLVILAAGCFCRQRRKKMAERVQRHHRERPHHHGHHHGHHRHHPTDNVYDNAVYSIGGAHAAPPPYDNISIKEAPPKYSLEDEYEKMAPPPDNVSIAYDNATYKVDDDAVSALSENARNRARE